MGWRNYLRPGILSGVFTAINLFAYNLEGRNAMASKGKENRIVATMACTVCKHRNYATSKNKKNNAERLELKKFCRTCRVHTAHRETR